VWHKIQQVEKLGCYDRVTKLPLKWEKKDERRMEKRREGQLNKNGAGKKMGKGFNTNKE